jgi:hypothetical protein
LAGLVFTRLVEPVIGTIYTRTKQQRRSRGGRQKGKQEGRGESKKEE